MSAFLTILIAIITSSFTSLATYLISIRSNKKTKEDDFLRDQKIKYFLPFKYYCNEFLQRLLHIENLSVSSPETLSQIFNSDFNNKTSDWYFTDYYVEDNQEKIGGYFFSSTIYMHCILFYKIKLLQVQYPYLKIHFKQQVDSFKTGNPQLQRCASNIKDLDKLTRKLKEIKTVRDIIEEIRTSTIMKNGIHYSLHDSFGDFVSNENGVIDFEQFCLKLANKNDRIKFTPLIIFWSKIPFDDLRIERIRQLIIILTLMSSSKLKEQ